MFRKGETYKGKYNYVAADENGKLNKAKDVLQMKILDVSDNFFTVKFYFFYDRSTHTFRGTNIGMGVYNKKDNIFKIIESLNQKLNGIITNNIEFTTVTGEKKNNKIHIEFIEAVNYQNNNSPILYAYTATIRKI